MSAKIVLPNGTTFYGTLEDAIRADAMLASPPKAAPVESPARPLDRRGPRNPRRRHNKRINHNAMTERNWDTFEAVQVICEYQESASLSDVVDLLSPALLREDWAQEPVPSSYEDRAHQLRNVTASRVAEVVNKGYLFSTERGTYQLTQRGHSL